MNRPGRSPIRAYRAHAKFIAPAGDSAAAWRLIPGLVMAAALYLLMLWAMQNLLQILLTPDQFNAFTLSVQNGSTAMGVLYLLFSFGFLGLAIAIVTAQMHQRAPLTLIGPPKAALRQGIAVLIGLILLSLVIWILPPSEVLAPITDSKPIGRWLMLLPVALLGILIQTSTEELIFRGYLQQQLAVRFDTPLIWMGLPALLFGLLHYRPEAGDRAWLLILWAALFSLIAADLTARAGTLGPAIALHFLSNAIAILFVAQDPALSGLALYSAPMDLADPVALRQALTLDIALLGLGWLTARLVLRR